MGRSLPLLKPVPSVTHSLAIIGLFKRGQPVALLIAEGK
jgi:hypothetical protein